MDGQADYESVVRICWALFRFLGGVPDYLSLECAGFAREPAKLEDQVQFLARTLI